jgi:kelch-like protein 2/3
MRTARAYHAVCVLDGCIFVSGGTIARQQYVASVEKYDPLTDSWSAVASMQHARTGHAMAVLNGHIYVAGGCWMNEDEEKEFLRSVERYDAATNSWSSVADMVEERDNLGLLVVNGRLTAMGGRGEQSVEQYDAATNTWSVAPAMQLPSVRNFSASCTVEVDAWPASTHPGRDNVWGRMLRERMKDATLAECALQKM